MRGRNPATNLSKLQHTATLCITLQRTMGGMGGGRETRREREGDTDIVSLSQMYVLRVNEWTINAFLPLPRYHLFLLYTASRCHSNTLQHMNDFRFFAKCHLFLLYSATHCHYNVNAFLSALHCTILPPDFCVDVTLQHISAHCNTLQHNKKHTATHGNTLNTHCNTLQHTALHCTTRRIQEE